MKVRVDSMDIIEMLAPINVNGARSGIKMSKVIGVTIHNTDNWNKGAGAKNHGAYLQNSGARNQVSWHYAVDDTNVIRSVPENEVAWHAGDGQGDGNFRTIAIEICLNPESDLTKATDNAAELAASILKKYSLPATALYQHNHWSGKNCPSQIRKGKPYSWDTFMSKVAEGMGVSDAKPVDKPNPVPYKEAIDQILHIGSHVKCTNNKFTVTNYDKPTGDVFIKELDTWVHPKDVTKIGNSNGSTYILYLKDQCYFTKNYMTVTKYDAPTGDVFLKEIDTWVHPKDFTEVA